MRTPIGGFFNPLDVGMGSGVALSIQVLSEAPLAIVGCTDSRVASKYGDRGAALYTIQDVAASIMGMMLVAHENGLGTVWVGTIVAGISDTFSPHIYFLVWKPKNV
ncbi:MAG TPA: nitroreductase family protein [Thermodesulfovibrionales bacterium]|nr:nitroreductase family protein [Thermodesulfovibrionales bacterium]